MSLAQKELGSKKRPNEVRHPAYVVRVPDPNNPGRWITLVHCSDSGQLLVRRLRAALLWESLNSNQSLSNGARARAQHNDRHGMRD